MTKYTTLRYIIERTILINKIRIEIFKKDSSGVWKCKYTHKGSTVETLQYIDLVEQVEQTEIIFTLITNHSGLLYTGAIYNE